MLIISGAFLVLIVCFGIEYLTKKRWLKVVLHSTLVAAIAVVVFRFALVAGADVERCDNARMVADTLEYFEDATQTNSLPEIRAKLSIIRQEIPKAIASGEPTTPMLLKVLGVEIPSNTVSTTPMGHGSSAVVGIATNTARLNFVR
jgi:hypothetical protein